jgi:hypothetical protein
MNRLNRCRYFMKSLQRRNKKRGLRMAHNAESTQTESRARVTLLEIHGRLEPEPRMHYTSHTFTLPAGAARVGVVFRYHRKHRVQMYTSLHSPDGFRGNAMDLSAYGDLQTELWVSPNDSSPGGIAGPLPAGAWRVQVDIDHLNEPAEYLLRVYAELGPVETAQADPYPAGHVVKAAAGWYRGELHCHTNESDGRKPVDEVIQAAEEVGLDFLSITDHFTISQWRRMGQRITAPLALIRSCEITSHHGHANLQGIREWVDVYVDRPDWSMNQAADAARAQDGLFCVNHPFSGGCSWKDFDFDWRKADLMEIYHALEGPNNNLQLAWWDHLLNQGLRIIGVAGTDSHNPWEGSHRLGRLVTWVHAAELSERGILDGLRTGNAFVSRGAELRFQAENARGETAEMGGRLAGANRPVTFSVWYRSERPLRLFIKKDGLLFNSLTLEDSQTGWRCFTFSDRCSRPGFYRVELHEAYNHPDFPGIEWQDFSTMQALSNPIWIE